MLVAVATEVCRRDFTVVDGGGDRSICSELLKTNRATEVEGELGTSGSALKGRSRAIGV